MLRSKPVFRNRPDTFLGVCEAIGQDFGINANIPRIGFAAFVLISPMAVAGIYVLLGIAVAVSRLAVPVLPVPSDTPGTATRQDAGNDAAGTPLAKAA